MAPCEEGEWTISLSGAQAPAVPPADRSMQALEYLVVAVALVAALLLAFLR